MKGCHSTVTNCNEGRAWHESAQVGSIARRVKSNAKERQKEQQQKGKDGGANHSWLPEPALKPVVIGCCDKNTLESLVF